METYDMHQSFSEPVIVGEATAGEAAATLAEIKKLVKGLAINTFDLAEKLHKVNKNKFYSPKHLTFGEYLKGLDIKLSKGYYLTRIAEQMEACQIDRATYEPVGIAKLRLISRIETANPDGTPKMYDGATGVEIVNAIIENASTATFENIEDFIYKVKGQVGEYAPTWNNISMTAGQKAKWDEAVELAKLNIGSVGKDAEGNYKDASVGACAEVIALSYILDPNNHPEGCDHDDGSGSNAND